MIVDGKVWEYCYYYNGRIWVTDRTHIAKQCGNQLSLRDDDEADDDFPEDFRPLLDVGEFDVFGKQLVMLHKNVRNV